MKEEKTIEVSVRDASKAFEIWRDGKWDQEGIIQIASNAFQLSEEFWEVPEYEEAFCDFLQMFEDNNIEIY